MSTPYRSLWGGVEAEVVDGVRLLTDAARAVRDHDGFNAEALRSIEMPEVFTGAKRGFFFQRHLRNDRFNVHTNNSHFVFAFSIAHFREKFHRQF